MTLDNLLFLAEFLWPHGKREYCLLHILLKGLYGTRCLKDTVHSRYSNTTVVPQALHCLTIRTTSTPNLPVPGLRPIVFRMFIHYEIPPVVCTLALLCLTPATQLLFTCLTPHLLFQKDGQDSGGKGESKGNLSLAGQLQWVGKLLWAL